METSELLPAVLTALAMQSPVILVCLAGCVVVLMRWRSLRAGAWPAFFGLGFALLLSVTRNSPPRRQTLVPDL